MFDNRMLSLYLILIPLVFFVFLLLGSGRKQEKLFVQIILANLFFGAGFALLLTQEHLNVFFGIILANTFIYSAFLLCLWVSLAIHEIKPPRWIFAVTGCIHLLGFLFFTYIKFHTLSRILILTGQIFLILLYGGIVLLRISRRRGSFRRPVAGALLFGSALFLVRILLTLWLNRRIESIFSPDFATGLSLLGGAVFILSWNLAIQIKRNTLYSFELKKNLDILHKTQKDIALLNSVYQYADQKKSIQHLFRRIFLIIEERFSIGHMTIILKPDQEDALRLAAFHGVEEEIISYLRGLGFAQSLSGRVIRSGKIERLKVSDYPDSPLKTALLENGYKSMVVYPLSTGFNTIGVFAVGHKKTTDLSQNDEETLVTICRQLGTLIFNYRHYEKLSLTEEKLRRQATTDPLTGIPNRREFMQRLEAEFASARRYGDPLTLFMLDLDDFKEINDTYGHGAGDDVLIQVGEILQGQMRQSDLYARFGGEEFIGVFTRTTAAQAEVSIGRLLEKIRKITLETVPPLNLTASIGIGELGEGNQTPQELIESADRALYEVKQRGKNGFIIAAGNR